MSHSTRRQFLSRGGSALGATWLSMSLPALISSCEKAWDEVDRDAAFSTLSEADAADLKAIAAQIFPTTDTPGANEAGVVHFLDKAFGSFFEGLLEPIQTQLQSLTAKSAEVTGISGSFADLSDDDQKAVMEVIAQEPFFGLFRFVITCGMFSNPGHGGNRNKVGWALLGFEDRHAWQPPFGYYDAEVQDGE